MFYLCYAAVGIPMTVMSLANIGQFVRRAVTRQMNRGIRFGQPVCARTIHNRWVYNSDEHALDEQNAVSLLLLLILYLLVGAIALGVDSTDSYMNGVFLNFRAITADYSDIVPNK